MNIGFFTIPQCFKPKGPHCFVYLWYCFHISTLHIRLKIGLYFGFAGHRHTMGVLGPLTVYAKNRKTSFLNGNL